MFGQLHIWPKSMGYHFKMFFGRNIQDFSGISKRYASKTSCDTTLTTPKPMFRPIDLFMMWPDSYCIYYPYIHTHTTYMYILRSKTQCVYSFLFFIFVGPLLFLCHAHARGVCPDGKQTWDMNSNDKKLLACTKYS